MPEEIMDTLDVDFKKVKELGNDLLIQLDRLRDQSPIYWSENQKAWIVTGNAEVTEALGSSLPLTVDRTRRIATFMPDAEERAHRIPYVLDIFNRMLLSQDPPEHTQMKRLVMKGFGRPVAEFYRPFARQVIAETLDEAADIGELDWVKGVTYKIAARIIVRLMGLSDDYLGQMRGWADATMAGTGGGGTTKEMLDATQAAFLEMRDAFMSEINTRRVRPGEDFISSLLASEIDGRRLTDDDIIATCIMSLIAGHDTTGNTMSLGTAALATNPEAWEHFRNPGEDVVASVFELQRYIGMTTAMARTAATDFDWHGYNIKKDQILYLMMGAANREPKYFPNPTKMDFTRSQDASLVFGSGVHFCVGHMLAKMQLGEFFPALVQKFDRIEVLDDRLDWSTVLGFRGLRSLNVRVHPR